MLKWCEKHVKQLGCSMVVIIVIIENNHELILTYGC